MQDTKHNLLLHRTFQYIALILILLGIVGSYYYFTVRGSTRNASMNALNTNGLVGQWSFDGKDTAWTSGTTGTVTDTSGNSNTGTLTNMARATSPVLGKIGQALTFDGTNDYVTAGDIDAMDGLNRLTVSGWIKTTATTEKHAIDKSFCDGIADHGAFELGVNFFTTGKGSFYIYKNGGSPTAYFVESSASVNDGNWHHLVGVYDGTNLLIYVDGVQGGSTSASGITMPSLVYSFEVGGNCNGHGGLFFPGQIDDVRVYNRALSASEIADLYKMGGVNTNTSASLPQGIGRLDSGLAGYWAFDDGSGTTPVDSSTNGHNATFGDAPTWTTGQIGGALSFDGSNDYVDMGDVAVLNNATAFTITTWVKDSDFADGGRLFHKRNGDNNDIMFGIWSDNQFYVEVGNGQNSYGLFSGYSSIVSSGVWYHIAMVYDGLGATDADRLKLYINGVERVMTYPSGSIPSSTADLSGFPFTVAKERTAGDFFKGLVDEVRIYNRALSVSEVTDLYRLTTPTGVDTSLKGYWPLDGGATRWTSSTAATTLDLSGAGNIGTLTNMAISTAPTQGKLGQALTFDGTNDSVTIPASSSINGLSTLTACAWVNPADTAVADPVVFSTYNAANTSGWDMYLVDLGGATWGLGSSAKMNTGNPYSFHNYNIDVIPSGAWSFVCVTQSGDASANIHLYLNGTELVGGVTQDATSRASDSTNGGIIGWTRDSSAASIFKGSIDDVRVYNRALSATEVAGLYNTGKATLNASTNALNTSGLIGQWSFDGKDTTWTSGTTGTVTDTSGNSNTGTLTNMARATSPVLGKIGQAFTFDRVNDYIDVGDTASLSLTGSFTLSAWVKAGGFNGSGGNDDNFIITKTSTTEWGYGLAATTDNGPEQFSVVASGDGVAGNVAVRYSTTNPVVGQWYHVVGVYSTATPSLNIYVTIFYI
jgi:hypothetical protein